MPIVFSSTLYAQQWSPLHRPSQLNTFQAMQVDPGTGDLVVLGTSNETWNLTGKLTVGRWDGTQWTIGAQSDSLPVYTHHDKMVLHGSDVYVYPGKLLRYSNNQWLQLPDTGSDIYLPFHIYSMTSFQNRLYASGIFYTKENDTTWNYNEPPVYFAWYDSNQWVPVKRFKGYIARLAAHDNRIYMAGSYSDTVTNTNASVGYLDSSGFHVLDTTWSYFDFVNGNDGLFLLGSNGLSVKLCRLDGNGLSEIAISSTILDACHAMGFYDQKLILSGCFDEQVAGIDIHHILAIDSTGKVLSLRGGCNADVTELAVWNNTLLAGGQFTMVDFMSAQGLAIWTGPISGMPENHEHTSGVPFPNPTSGVVNIPIDEHSHTIEVFTLSGRLMLSEHIMPGSKGWFRLDTSSLSEGLYILVCNGDTGANAYKIRVWR